MAGFDYTTTGLLASLKRRGMIPSSDEALATSDFLAIADEELQTYIVPLLISVREEYLVTSKDFTPDGSTYPIPPGAIGGKLRDVLISNGSGGFYALPRIEPERVENWGTTGGPVGYKLEGNNVVLVPAATPTGTLRMTFFRRPSHLVATSAVATITAINTGTSTATTNLNPSTFSTSQSFDFIKANPGFDALYESATATTATASGTSWIGSVLSSNTAGAAVGDYICLAGDSPVPQVPVELHALLSHRIVWRVLEALGDPKAAVAERTCDRLEKSVIKTLTPRVEGASRPIINYNGPGWGRGRYRGWRY